MKLTLKKIDIFTIFIHVTYLVSLVKVITLDLIPINSTVTLTFLMIIIYLYRFNTHINAFLRHSILLKLFFAIYFFDVLQCLYRDPASALIRSLAGIDMFLFMSYVANIITKQSRAGIIPSIHNAVKPYLYFSVYNVAIVIIAAVLIWTGLIGITENMIPVNSITKTDVESGQIYYFPKYISIVTQTMRIFSNVGIPMITGLTHEPHVFNYLVLPALFILLSINRFAKHKFLLYALFFAASLFATSTTAMICFALLFLIDVVWSFLINRKFSNMLPLLTIVFIVFLFGSVVIDLLKNEIVRKTVVDTGSMEYSGNILKYVLSPNSIIGEGNMPSQFGYKMTTGNVGLITCVLDVLFFIVYVYQSLKLVANRNAQIHYLGLSFLYIILHSLKIWLHIFNYPLFGMLILLNVILYEYSKSKISSSVN